MPNVQNDEIVCWNRMSFPKFTPFGLIYSIKLACIYAIREKLCVKAKSSKLSQVEFRLSQEQVRAKATCETKTKPG